MKREDCKHCASVSPKPCPEHDAKPKFEIVDLGVHHPDSFQGFGTSFTQFEHSTYGIGNTAEEAFQDALEQLECSNGSELHGAASAALLDMPDRCPFGGAVETHPDDTGMNDDYNQRYYHVGIRWNS